MYKITVFTGTRAEYHLLYSVMKRIQDDPELELDLIVTGSHLSERFGNTFKVIEDEGFHISEKIKILSDTGDTNIDEAISKCLLGCSKHFDVIHSDLLLILGDRYELMGVVLAASNHHIPIAHIHGGETTEGAVDEAIRHAVTKFSFLHFTCCEQYRNRVIQLGEDPSRVFNVGGLGVENIKSQSLMTKMELSENLGFKLDCFGLVTFHPVTLETDGSVNQIHELMEALLSFKEMNFIVTKANADAGGEEINRMLDMYAEKYPDKFLVVYSLGMIRYLSAMKYASLVIGNSSSGILEAPSFRVPTINIGDRQKGRMQCKSIINCNPEQADIIKAMKLGLDKKFVDELISLESPYGIGNTSKQIVIQLKHWLDYGIDIKKKFYDIDFLSERI